MFVTLSPMRKRKTLGGEATLKKSTNGYRNLMDNFVNDSLVMPTATNTKTSRNNYLCKSVQGTVTELDRRIRLLALEDRSTPKAFAAIPSTHNKSLLARSRVSPIKDIKGARPIATATSFFEQDAIRMSSTAFGEARPAVRKSSVMGDSRHGGEIRNQSRHGMISTRAEDRNRLKNTDSDGSLRTISISADPSSVRRQIGSRSSTVQSSIISRLSQKLKLNTARKQMSRPSQLASLTIDKPTDLTDRSKFNNGMNSIQRPHSQFKAVAVRTEFYEKRKMVDNIVEKNMAVMNQSILENFPVSPV